MPCLSLDGHRLAIDGIDSLLRLEGLKLDVLRRAMDCQQETIHTLNGDRCTHLKLADECLASAVTSRPYPFLPEEIIVRICNFLYYLGGEESQSTARRFVDDPDTPDSWRRLILRDIPVVFSGESEFETHRDPYFSLRVANIVGWDPVVYSMHQLSNNDVRLHGRSITLLVNPKGWQALAEELPKICQFPWRNLILSLDLFWNGEDRMAIMNTFIQNYGHKFACLDRLDIYPFLDNSITTDEDRLWDPLHVLETQDIVPKLRSALLHLSLLPILHQFLSAITTLEIGIPGDESALSMNFTDVYNILKPLANTLVSLILRDDTRNSRWTQESRPRNGDAVSFPVTNVHGNYVTFPQLKRLDLNQIAECIIVHAIRILDCPSLSEITIRTGWDEHKGDVECPRFSASLLHQMHPSLECVTVALQDYSVRSILTSPNVFPNHFRN